MMKRFFCLLAIVLAFVCALIAKPATQMAKQSKKPPNILFAIADDWSYPHAGIYGDKVVRTPTFDRIAGEGALFTNSYTASPSCTPSRGAILTGRYPHELEEGGNLWTILTRKFQVYTDILEANGYELGLMRKGWGPGDLEGSGRKHNHAGIQYKSFEEFFDKLPKDKPFCFWFGGNDPHRPYDKGTGRQAGLKAEDVVVPAFWPDTPEIRDDILDYYFEVERFDRDLGQIIAVLEKAGQLDNTLIVVTSDNGWPFPRAKTNLYDAGTRMPLAIRWPGKVKAGTVINDFVSHTDFAPTFLEAVGLKPLSMMTGKSLIPLLEGKKQKGRDKAFFERERHANVRKGDLGYPMRAVRTNQFLYIRNFKPDRWPAGDPEFYHSVGPYGDIDGSPTKDFLMERKDDPKFANFFRLSFEKRPAEELYDLSKDPDQVNNIADRAEYAKVRKQMKAELSRWMKQTGDPRSVNENDDRWDRYRYVGPPAKAPGK